VIIVNWFYSNFNNFPIIFLLLILFVAIYFAFSLWSKNEYKTLVICIAIIFLVSFLLLIFICQINEVQIIINGSLFNFAIACVIVVFYPIVVMMFLAFMRMFFVKVDKKHGENLEKEVARTELAHKAALERHLKHQNSNKSF